MLNLASISCFAQDSIPKIQLQKTYIVNEESIYFPLGNMAFADSIVSFKIGLPSPRKEFRDPKSALGEPDHKHYMDNSYVSLGCKGELVLMFTDNGFIDIEGDDLYIFEIGPSVEGVEVDISVDGEDWIYIGRVDGGTASLDIAQSQRVRMEDEVYYYIRIRDLGDFCQGPTPGADIDAVGVIGGVLKFNLSSSVLFDSDKYELKAHAVAELDEIIEILQLMPYSYVQIDGHTDGDASYEYNYELGMNRAKAVQNYIYKEFSKLEEAYYIGSSISSFGKTRPVSTNKTEEGKQLNRRVELLIFPPDNFYEKPTNKN